MKKLSERAVIVIHPIMENPLRAGMPGNTFQTYQLVLPRMVGMSIDDPSDTSEERDKAKADLIAYAKDIVLADVELMSVEKYDRLRAEEALEREEWKKEMLK